MSTLESSWRELTRGAVAAVPVGNADAAPSVVFPGSFHPLHDGHRAMAEHAMQWTGHRVTFELSVENVDKQCLDLGDVRRRLGQFAADQSVWLTRAARFLDKARLFPAATFVVGADTILRIADDRYYAESGDRDRALHGLAEAGVKFLVFGRLVGQTFAGLSQLELPAELRSLCDGVDEHVFRVDLSLTSLRREVSDS